jgi:hypothetical protein
MASTLVHAVRTKFIENQFTVLKFMRLSKLAAQSVCSVGYVNSAECVCVVDRSDQTRAMHVGSRPDRLPDTFCLYYRSGPVPPDGPASVIVMLGGNHD